MGLGHLRILLSAPTGSGKTVLIASILRSAAEKGNRAIIIAPRTEIVAETARKFLRAGLDIGLISGTATWGEDRMILVCTAQTLERRGIPAGTKLAVNDEADEIRNAVVREQIRQKIRVIGMTATPMAPRLGGIYQELVSLPSTDRLIAAGHLVPPRIFPGVPVDTDGLDVNSAGEWRDADLEARTIPVIGDVVDGWDSGVHEHFGGPVKTLVFSPTIAAGADFVRRFGDKGYHFEQVGASVQPEEAAAAIKAFREDPGVHGLVSCTALEMGADFPAVRCLVIARAYRKAVARIIQQYGRGLRTFEDKKYVLVNDHVRNYVRHAEAIEEFWSKGVSELPNSNSKRPVEVLSRRAAEARTPTCKSCGQVLQPKMTHCVQCGAARPRRKVDPEVDGKLREVERGSIKNPKPGKPPPPPPLPPNLWDQLSTVAIREYPDDRKKALKKAKGIYKDLKKQWPAWGIELGPEVPVDFHVEEAIQRARRRYWARKGKRK